MGVDVMRWIYCRQNPASNLNFGYGAGRRGPARALLTLWNVYSFFVTYANLDGCDAGAGRRRRAAAADARPLDPVASCTSSSRTCTAALEDYDAATATRARRGVRRRPLQLVRAPQPAPLLEERDDADKQRGLRRRSTTCLVTLAQLLAPFMPFLAEEMYQNLVRSHDDRRAGERAPLRLAGGGPLAGRPAPRSSETRLVMRVVSLGRAARSKAGIKVRQPLAVLS